MLLIASLRYVATGLDFDLDHIDLRRFDAFADTASLRFENILPHLLSHVPPLGAGPDFFDGLLLDVAHGERSLVVGAANRDSTIPQDDELLVGSGTIAVDGGRALLGLNHISPAMKTLPNEIDPG